MTLRETAIEMYRSVLPVLVVSSFGGLLAGVILGGMKTQLATVQGLLVMIPAFLAIRGSVYGSLGSRLSSALHQGMSAPSITWDERVIAAVSAAFLTGLVTSLFAAVAAFALLTGLDRTVAPLFTLLLIALIGGILAGIAMATTIVTVVFAGYQRGWNPDDLVGPVMTVAGDIFGMLSLYLATHIVLWLQ